jgi:hypothetical protein
MWTFYRTFSGAFAALRPFALLFLVIFIICLLLLDFLRQRPASTLTGVVTFFAERGPAKESVIATQLPVVGKGEV